ncbi:DUF2884 family protein [Gammaproteobacteria bacterium AB-CW1]|uniref:DUF2884 family protein n=1 Tax=Natronospira elongata TaxID=3110268 RepID=A0AAP6JEY4_9GAMM|nr:DUF2884 family protein [Gammaproteobacteria bacterium AB-CW1]
MSKQLTMSSLLLAATMALGSMAQAAQFNSDCRVSLAPKLEITQSHVEVADEQRTARFSGGSLTVDGQTMPLSAEGSARAAAYEQEVRELVEEFRVIAAEAVDIGIYAASTAVTTVFGETATRNLNADLESLREELLEAIATTTDFNAETFGQQIDQSVKQAVENAKPELIKAGIGLALTALLLGEEHIEERVAGLEETIEAEVEARAAEIEAHAEALCPRLKALAAKEEALVAELDEAQQFRFIQPGK